MPHPTTDRRTFLSGIAASSVLGMAGQTGGMPASTGGIIDPDLFEQGESTIRLTIDGITPTADREGAFIECFAWAWDMAVPEDLSGGPDVSPVNVLKAVDETTPQLMKALVQGRILPKAVLSISVQDPSGRARETLRLTMQTVRVIYVGDEGQTSFGMHPETVALVAQQITVSHPESGYEVVWNVHGE